MEFLPEFILALTALIGAFTALRKIYNERESGVNKEWQEVVEKLEAQYERLDKTVSDLEDQVKKRDEVIAEQGETIKSLRKEVTVLTNKLNALGKKREAEIEGLEYLMSVAIDHMDDLSDMLEELNVTPPRKPQEIISWLEKYKAKRSPPE